MKKLLLTGVAFSALIAGPAMAADLERPVYRAPVVVAPVWSWTGFYIGGNVGYSITGGNSSSAHLLNGAGVEQMQTFFSLAPSGWVGGGQIGFNWQVAPYIVLGAEWDWSWSNQKESDCGIAGMACVNTPSPNGVSSLTQQYDWLSTLRARLGWAHNDWLFFVTGGGAWAKVDTSLTANCPTGCGNLGGPSFGAGSFTDSRSGYAVGVGIEVMLWANWTAKVEYLHLDFGTVTHAITTAPVLASVTVNEQLRDNIVRVGLNYKFGYAAAPAVYK